MLPRLSHVLSTIAVTLLQMTHPLLEGFYKINFCTTLCVLPSCLQRMSSSSPSPTQNCHHLGGTLGPGGPCKNCGKVPVHDESTGKTVYKDGAVAPASLRASTSSARLPVAAVRHEELKAVAKVGPTFAYDPSTGLSAELPPGMRKASDAVIRAHIASQK
jgi:hypothetical protein